MIIRNTLDDDAMVVELVMDKETYLILDEARHIVQKKLSILPSFDEMLNASIQCFRLDVFESSFPISDGENK